MKKKEILSQYHEAEEKQLIAKLLDKVEQCNRKNEIMVTEFFDLYQQRILEDVLKQIEKSYVYYGGYENASRVNVIIYPEGFSKEEVMQQYGKFVEAIRITLPKSLQGKYQHRDYLGGMMKLGIKREKTGDILCDQTGADIIVQKVITQYLMDNLPYLTRFSKAKFEVIPFEQIRKIEVQKQEITIITSSLRLDNIIAELLGVSRTNANEVLAQKRVFLNYRNERKSSKLVKKQDIIVIRGKGKYEFNCIKGNTKKNRLVLTFSKYM